MTERITIPLALITKGSCRSQGPMKIQVWKSYRITRDELASRAWRCLTLVKAGDHKILLKLFCKSLPHSRAYTETNCAQHKKHEEKVPHQHFAGDALRTGVNPFLFICNATYYNSYMTTGWSGDYD